MGTSSGERVWPMANSGPPQQNAQNPKVGRIRLNRRWDLRIYGVPADAHCTGNNFLGMIRNNG